MMRRVGPMMGSWPRGGWGMALMMTGMVVLWCLLAAGVIAVLLFVARRSRSSSTEAASPHEILAQQFVRGELDEEDYLHRIRVLSGNSP